MQEGARIQPRAPELRMGYLPVWCHHHCHKMRLTEHDVVNRRLVIAGSAATLTIEPPSGPLMNTWTVTWKVTWKIRHSWGEVQGCIWFKKEELMTAFGIIDGPCRFGQWIIDQYGADAAEQGQYIRWREFLNIPCPGTGHDGDPNISIELDTKIHDAVRRLLA